MTRTPDLILGLDGGGTKTLLAVADRDGTLHHLARGPTLDPFADPDWPAALRSALGEIGPVGPWMAAAVLGLPCFGEVASVSAQQREVARRLCPWPLDVVNDVEAAFDGALAGTPGVLLLAGTGSMAWAGDGRRTLRCGGWGDMFGDEGSAYWIGREALARACRILDGRAPPASFAERLLDLIGLEPGELLGWCYGLTARRRAIAALAFHVDTLAETGEPTARELLAAAGDALAAHGRACADRLGLPAAFTWSTAGSVFASRTVLARVTERLGTAPRAPRLPPLGGTLMRAARRAGWPIDDAWIERLDGALSRHGRSAQAA